MTEKKSKKISSPKPSGSGKNLKPKLPEGKIKFPKARMRRIMRGPLFWIVLALVVVSLFGRISTSGKQFVKTDTSTLLAAISAEKVDSAKIIDKDQRLEVVLKSGQYIKGSQRLYASYVTGEEPGIVELLTLSLIHI